MTIFKERADVAQLVEQGIHKPLKESGQPSNNNDLQQSAQTVRAQTRARNPKTAHSDPDLALLIERWDSLTEPVKAGIVAMVKAASGSQ